MWWPIRSALRQWRRRDAQPGWPQLGYRLKCRPTRWRLVSTINWVTKAGFDRRRLSVQAVSGNPTVFFRLVFRNQFEDGGWGRGTPLYWPKPAGNSCHMTVRVNASNFPATNHERPKQIPDRNKPRRWRDGHGETAREGKRQAQAFACELLVVIAIIAILACAAAGTGKAKAKGQTDLCISNLKSKWGWPSAMYPGDNAGYYPGSLWVEWRVPSTMSGKPALHVWKKSPCLSGSGGVGGKRGMMANTIADALSLR